MPALSDLISAANDWLSIDAIADYPGALNGLQLANSGSGHEDRGCRRCLPPGDRGGLCQRGESPRRPPRALLAGRATDRGGALPEVENWRWTTTSRFIRRICRSTCIRSSETTRSSSRPSVLREKGRPFAPWKGRDLGQRVTCDLDRDELLARVAAAVGDTPKLAPGGPERVRELGVITGGAGSQIHELAATGIDTFLTGEGPHWSYTAAEELGVNLIYAGHYATETFGVKALAARWAAEFPGSRSPSLTTRRGCDGRGGSFLPGDEGGVGSRINRVETVDVASGGDQKTPPGGRGGDRR